MKVSLPWLKRFVNFKQSASELADLLTMLGFESEVVTDFSVLQNIVVGEVESAKKHPNADKLKLCIVNDGKTTHEVVCGAPNVATGQKIVFAKVKSKGDSSFIGSKLSVLHGDNRFNIGALTGVMTTQGQDLGSEVTEYHQIEDNYEREN